MNILENRLKEIENNEEKNIFKHRIKKVLRNGSGILKTEPFSFKSFNFNGNLHSDKIETEKFTNFISSYENKYYEILTQLFDKLKNDNYEFLNEFELDEYIASEYSEANKRLKRIIKKANNLKEESILPKIDKFKPSKYIRKKEKRFDGIRLYVSKDNSGNIDLYLVDLYHLAIDAFDYRLRRYNLDGNYRSKKEFDKCISKIADHYIEN